nr:IS66 family transposase [Bradyrhizobium diazoefficiens]
MAGLTRFIDDGRIEIDNNTVERSIKPIGLGKRNYLFAGRSRRRNLGRSRVAH